MCVWELLLPRDIQSVHVYVLRWNEIREFIIEKKNIIEHLIPKDAKTK